MKDMRYRLSSALADAGLAHTEYAKDVMKYLYHWRKKIQINFLIFIFYILFQKSKKSSSII